MQFSRCVPVAALTQITFAVFFALGLTGCRASSSTFPVAAPVPSILSRYQPLGSRMSSEWIRLEGRTACPGKCAGKDGFAVNQDGHFIVGPDAADRTVEGQISNDDFAALDHAAALVAATGKDESKDFCTSSGTLLSSSSGIRMILSDESSFVAHDQRVDGTLCMRGEREVVNEFEAIFSRVMNKYSPE